METFVIISDEQRTFFSFLARCLDEIGFEMKREWSSWATFEDTIFSLARARSVFPHTLCRCYTYV